MQGKLMITSINQWQELKSIKDVETAREGNCCSNEWIDINGVEANKLNLNSILKHGHLTRRAIKDENNSTLRFTFHKAVLDKLEEQLKRIGEICKDRIGWLLKDSRRTFGLIREKRVCVLLDTSNSNMSPERSNQLKEHLKILTDEQFKSKENIFIMNLGTSPHMLWNSSKCVTPTVLKQLHGWISKLQPSGGCNVLHGLRKVLKTENMFDGIILVMGSLPDQCPQRVVDFVKEATSGRHLPFHTVSYQCGNEATNMFLRDLARVTDGYFHIFSHDETEILSGTEISLLNDEIRKVNQVLTDLEYLKNGGQINNMLFTVLNKERIDDSPNQSKAVVKMEFSDIHLEFSKDSGLTPSSLQWLKTFGLKALKLTLYQVMAPNAFSSVSNYVPSIRKTVTSKVNSKSMIQLDWHDGSVKNCHVDPATLLAYKNNLDLALKQYKSQVAWLASNSRQIFGNIAEKSVVLLVDVSSLRCRDGTQFKLNFKRLLEQQIVSTRSFNVICYGNKVYPFKPQMVATFPESLNSCWRWLQTIEFGGGRNFLEAFQQTVENEKERSHGIVADGIYAIFSGPPQQPLEVVTSFVGEALVGTKTVLNCIYCEPPSEEMSLLDVISIQPDFTTNYFRSLSQMCKGRFHWSRSSEIVECTDIHDVMAEIDKAYNYRQKADMLLDSLIQREKKDVAAKCQDLLPVSSTVRVGLPRQTKLSKARVQSAHPTNRSSGVDITDVDCQKKTKVQRPKSCVEQRHASKPLVMQLFYTDVCNEKVAVAKPTKHEPQSSSSRFNFNSSIPRKEEVISSKDWLRKYGLMKMKLDLKSIINTSACLHNGFHGDLSRDVKTRHCSGIPVATINGIKKHILIGAHDLETYEACLGSVLRRYLSRIHWLQSGSRRVFGTILESHVVILIDVSGSMIDHFEKLKKEIEVVLWDQLQEQKVRFNLMAFSSTVKAWHNTITMATNQSCKEAMLWMNTIQCEGGTCTLDALNFAYNQHGIEAIYLLTDGKPDTSMAAIVENIKILHLSKPIKIHTISFNCEDRSCISFLRTLSKTTKGRYHNANRIDAHNARQLSCDGSVFGLDDGKHHRSSQGDDFEIMMKETSLCRQYILQSRDYRSLLQVNQK